MTARMNPHSRRCHMRHPFTRMNAGRAAGEGCGLKDLLTGKMVLSQGAKCAASRGRTASSHQKTGSIQMGLSGSHFVPGGSGDSPGGLVQPQRGFPCRWWVWRKCQLSPQPTQALEVGCHAQVLGATEATEEKPLAGQVSVRTQQAC